MNFYNNSTITEKLFGNSLLSKIIFVSISVILLYLSASQTKIPLYPVPVSFQTLVVLIISATSGMLGFYSVITYLALGFLGLPIFALGGGPTYIFQPTAGYLYGMGIASFLVAYSAEKLFKESFFKILLTLLSGTLIIFAFGIIHLSVFGKIASTGDPFGISLAIQYGLKPFVLIESLKVLFALFFIYALLKKTKKIN